MTQRTIWCLALTLLTVCALRFHAGRGTPAASRPPPEVLADSAVETVNHPPSSARLQRHSPPPLRSDGSLEDATPFLEGVAGLPGHTDPQQRQVELAQLVAAAGVVLLRDVLADEAAVLVLPEDVYQAILKHLATEDAPWTAAYMEALPAGAFRTELLGAVLAQWSTHDAPAAIAWAQQLADVSLQQTALIHVSYRWFELDPKGALAYAAGLPAEHAQFVTTLLGQWGRQAPAEAAAWAMQVRDGAVRERAIASAVAAWAENDARAAAEFVAKLPPGHLQKEAAVSVVSAWAQNEPATAAQWVAAFPAGRERDYAVENLIYRWAPFDPASALVWINRLPATERDPAIHAGAGGLIETRPDLATAWAVAIGNDGKRSQQAERAARQWLATDRSAAEAWIRQSLLPGEEKQRLLAAAQPGG
ncbi:MAG: hypothetical protein ACREH8_04155 [Opitutaceae bacterium]